MSEARRLLDEALRANSSELVDGAAAAARAAGEGDVLGLCLVHRAWMAIGVSDGRAALARAREAVALLRAAGDAPMLGYALLAEAQAVDAIELVEAPGVERRPLATLREALPLLEAGGLLAEAGLAYELLASWDEAQAEAHLRRAFAVYQASASRLGAPRALRRLAQLALAHGDAAGALAHLEQALALLRAEKIGQNPRVDEARTLELCGDAHRLAGDAAAADARYREALALFERIGHAGARKLRARLESA